jgi:hypothetical protein
MNQDQQAPPPPATDQERRTALDEAINREIMAGGKLLGQAGSEGVIAYGGGAGNLVAILLTGGLWILAYPLWRQRRYVLAVNERAQVWRRHVNDIRADAWERVDD